MKRFIVGCFFLLISVFLNSRLESTQWDIEYWQYLNWKNWEGGPYKLYTMGEVRLYRDISRVCYYKISENFAYKAGPQLNLEAHYSYIYDKSKDSTRFKNTHRLEFEINPFFKLEDGITFKWRNRLELLKKQDVSHIQFVARHRAMISFPIKHCSSLSSINVYDEIFYDFDTNKFTQNRFIPLELSFILNQDTTLNLFLMLRHFYSFSSEIWGRSIVLGSEFGF